MLALLVIVVVLIYFAIEESERKSRIKSAQESQKNVVSKLSNNSIYDICYALGCMVAFSALNDSKEESSTLLIRVNYEYNETEIYAHGGNWISNYKNVNEYTKLGVPQYIAIYLSQIDFVIGENGALKMKVSYAANTETIMKKIRESMSLLPYNPGHTQLKSYPLVGNSQEICVDYFVVRD